MAFTSALNWTTLHDEIERLCLESAKSGELVTKVRAFRVSSSQASLFIANLQANLKIVDHNDPAVVAARDIGGVLVERTVEGAAARKQYGTITISPSILTERDTSQAVVGYATRFGGTIFLYLMATAASANLDDADAAEDRGNAAVESFRQTMRAASTVGQQVDPSLRLEMYFSDETRACRSRTQGGRLIATMKQYGVFLYLRGTRWDPRKMGDEQIIDMLLGQAATERDLSVARLARGKVSLLAVHRLPERLGSNVPFTHGAYEEQRTDENGLTHSVPDDRRPVPMAGSGERLDRLVRAVLRAGREAEDAGETYVDWDGVASELAANLDLRERSPEALSKGSQPRLISDLDHPGSALKRLLGKSYRAAWRTGRLPWVTKLAVEVPELQEQAGTIRYTPDRKVILTAWVECPIPVGLTITEAEWIELDEILTTKPTNAGKPQTGFESPFSSARYVSGGREWEINTSDGYRLESRAARFARSGAKAKGWPSKPEARDKQDVVHHGTANAHTLHKAIGLALGELAVGLEDQVLALETTRPRRTRADGARLAVLESRIAEAEQKRVDSDLMAAGAREERYRAAANKDEAARARAETDEGAFLSAADVAAKQVDDLSAELVELRLDGEPAEPDDQPSIRLASIEQVAAALQTKWSTSGRTPPEVTAAIRRVFRRSLRLELAGHRIHWAVTAHLPMSDGRLGTFELSGSVTSRQGGHTAHSNNNQIARLFLWEGKTHAEIGETFGVDGSGKKNSYLIQRLKNWLNPDSPSELRRGDDREARAGIASADLRRATLDAPLAARRVAYAIAVDDLSLLRHDFDPLYVDLIRSTYFDQPQTAWWSESWAAGDWQLQRRLMALILDQPDPSTGIAVLDAAATLGAEYEKLVAFTGDRVEPASGRRVPAMFNRSWTRTDKSPMEDRRISAKECPWPKCPGRGAGSGSSKVRSRFVPAAHILFVPEVPVGLICPSCHRIPDLEAPYAGARFPDEYLLGHRRRTKALDGVRSGTVIEASSWWTPWP